MKNWDPFVCLPAFAIDRRNGWVCFTSKFSSFFFIERKLKKRRVIMENKVMYKIKTNHRILDRRWIFHLYRYGSWNLHLEPWTMYIVFGGGGEGKWGREKSYGKVSILVYNRKKNKHAPLEWLYEKDSPHTQIHADQYKVLENYVPFWGLYHRIVGIRYDRMVLNLSQCRTFKNAFAWIKSKQKQGCESTYEYIRPRNEVFWLSIGVE